MQVASTNWKKIMMILSEKSNTTDLEAISSDAAHKDNHMLTLDQYPTKNISHIFQTYIKFTFVRHPFERLVSAYNNKFVKANDASFYRNVHGTKIIAKYRTNPSEQSLQTGDDVTFAEFVQYVIDQWKTGELMDVHWRPMVDLSSPCHVHYDVIGKFETLKQDADFVLKLAGLDKVIQFPGFQPAISGSSLQSYLHQLNARQREMILFHVYKFDFELFGYSTVF